MIFHTSMLAAPLRAVFIAIAFAMIITPMLIIFFFGWREATVVSTSSSLFLVTVLLGCLCGFVAGAALAYMGSIGADHEI